MYGKYRYFITNPGSRIKLRAKGTSPTKAKGRNIAPTQGSEEGTLAVEKRREQDRKTFPEKGKTRGEAPPALPGSSERKPPRQKETDTRREAKTLLCRKQQKTVRRYTLIRTICKRSRAKRKANQRKTRRTKPSVKRKADRNKIPPTIGDHFETQGIGRSNPDRGMNRTARIISPQNIRKRPLPPPRRTHGSNP